MGTEQECILLSFVGRPAPDLELCPTDREFGTTFDVLCRKSGSALFVFIAAMGRTCVWPTAAHRADSLLSNSLAPTRLQGIVATLDPHSVAWVLGHHQMTRVK